MPGMTTRRSGIGRAVAALVLAIGAAGVAEAAPITFAFTAENLSDPGGTPLTGTFTYDTDTPTVSTIEPRIFGGSALHPIAGTVFYPGGQYTFEAVGSGRIRAIQVGNDIPSTGDDAFILRLRDLDESGFIRAQLQLFLIDEQATAFASSAALPTTLDLSLFEDRSIEFVRVEGGQFLANFQGRLTSLTPLSVIPEPSTIALCGIAAGGVALAVRRRKVA